MVGGVVMWVGRPYLIFELWKFWRSNMTESELKNRTKRFAFRILKLVSSLPDTLPGRAIANQLLRAGMSVGANYRAACRGRSKADFISRLGIVEEEADETAYWLEIIIEGGMLPPKRVNPLWQKANELVAIMVSSRKTAAQSAPIPKPSPPQVHPRSKLNEANPQPPESL